MASNKLTDHQCRIAKAGEKPRKLSDGNGMYLFISTTGAKIWRIGYRLRGKEQTEVLGPYPLLSLADARFKRDEFRRKLLDGQDVKAKAKKSITFTEAAATYWAGRKDVSDGYKDNATRGLAMHLEYAIGNKPINAITRDKLLELLLKLDGQGKHVYAKRLRVWAGQVFDWAIEHGYCEQNPAALIRPDKAFGRVPVKHHPALKLSEVPDFMQALALENALQSVLACKFLAYTWVRTKEMRFMEWGELEGDLWRIPAARMKKRREHLVPLSTQALGVLNAMHQRSHGSKYVFSSPLRPDRTISENTVLYLLLRMGYKDRMSGHGWRSVGSTWANENGYNADWVEMQLAHDDDNEVRGAYNNALYLAQRRAMLQAYGDWLDDQINSGVKQG